MAVDESNSHVCDARWVSVTGGVDEQCRTSARAERRPHRMGSRCRVVAGPRYRQRADQA
ncbi:hypothetical protein [Lysobacter gummosus]|uniref:hypothetical protein n=1 Tax=Lysobacter gummosus TaxID=262324 RepID=UPI00362C2850